MKKCFCMYATRNKVPGAARNKRRAAFPTLCTALAALCLLCAALCLGGCAGGRQMASESRTVSLEREYARSAEVLHVRDTVVLGVPLREGNRGYREDSVTRSTRGTGSTRGTRSTKGSSSTRGTKGTSWTGALPVYRSHYETLRVHDTVLVTRTDTLVRTETRTVRERYVPPWLRRYAVGVTLLAAGLLLAAGAAWYVRRRMRLWR